MQAIILAAGKGTRLRPLTFATPKPLLIVAGKPILEHTLNALPEEIKEAVLVIGYLGEQIKRYFGSEYKGRKITYIHQKKQLGTFNALKQARPALGGSFLSLMGDDLYNQKDLARLLKFDHAVLVRKVTGPSEMFGVCLVRDRCLVKDILEKQSGLKFKFANCGAFKLTQDIFKEKIIYGPTGEEWLSSMIGSLAKKKPVRVVEAKRWFPIATPNDLKNAHKFLALKKEK